MKKLQFPKNFLWGTATSAHQVEGGNKNNDWWEFEWQGKVKNGEISGNACDHYNHFEEDFSLVKKFNQNAHRVSLEWSRIEPEINHWNFEEIKHYQEVLGSLKKKKIKVVATLWHFTNPLWLSKIGGWENKETIQRFEKYTQCVIKYLGEYIDFWVTLNEPTIYAQQAYIKGYWPPQKKSLLKGIKVVRNMIEAHRKAYEIISQSIPKAKIGLATNNTYYLPADPKSFLDKILIKISRYFVNFYFLDQIKNYQNFIGLNYYFIRKVNLQSIVKKQDYFLWRDKSLKKSDLGWLIYPEGIYKILLELKKYKLPIYITENGLADEKDKLRAEFILEHLKYVLKAIKEEVNVRGYFHWSLLDNFEWREGFSPRFGLIEVDYKTFKRTPRKSAYLYSEICKQNGISERIVKKYVPELSKTMFKT